MGSIGPAKGRTVTMTSKALLFDVDGTLIDSTYVHVECWWAAFVECGITVPRVEVHRRIGMDGALLVQELLEEFGGDHVDGAGSKGLAERVTALHGRYYSADETRLRPLPGARELLIAARDAGYTVALATASSPEEFELARDVLGCGDEISAVTTGDDVDTAKPDSSVVDLAVRRAGVAPSEAIMIGDATWDAIAAGKAGVPSIAVRTGGIGDAELRDAGYARIVDGVDVLRREVAESGEISV